ncbi:MAG: outer membrane protein assembly factor BamD [Myxococcota bacterium]|nr:outer membrane protein assembly factor BamD [Myxococcota bacterium]
MRFLILVLLSVWTMGPALAAGSVEERFEDGQRYLRRGYYTKALEEFQAIRNHHREHPMSILSELAIADVYYDQGEWDLARVSYADFQRLHPRHEKLDYVVYKLGLASWEKASRIADRDQTWTRQAVNTWSNFPQRFPESEHLDEVVGLLESSRNRLARKELRIARFYYKRDAHVASIGRLDGLLTQYPESPDVPQAIAMLAVSLEQTGELERAAEMAAALSENHPEAKKAHRHLRWRYSATDSEL